MILVQIDYIRVNICDELGRVCLLYIIIDLMLEDNNMRIEEWNELK